MNIPEPPKWAVRFLKWYCNPRFLEEIEGDVYELFDRRVAKEGLKMARFKFHWDVLRFFRWSNIKRSNSKYMNHFGLFSNYLKLGFRNLTRNALTSAINIFGLAIAVGITLTTFIFLDRQFNFDQFHANRDRIYQVVNRVEEEGRDRLWSDSPITLGPNLLNDHPSVEAFTRIEYASGAVRYASKVLQEQMVFVDDTYFDLFDFGVLEGDQDALKRNDQVVLSHKVARKFFGDVSAVGKEIEIKYSNQEIRRYTVGAVLQPYPYNAAIKFGIHIPYDQMFEVGIVDRRHDTRILTDATFILMKAEQDVHGIYTSFDDYVKNYNDADPEWTILNFQTIGLTELPFRAHEIYSGMIPSLPPGIKRAFIVVSLLLLAMAAFNFMNISITGVSRRLKEVGIRKVMGGERQQLIKQFMVENLLLTGFSLIVGTLLAYYFFTPGFDLLTPQIRLEFRAAAWQDMVGLYLSLWLIVSLISGAYPAFYVSRFHPISILKGTGKLKGRNAFSSTLLGFQFLMAFITIVGCFIFSDQTMYLQDRTWGYDPEEVLSVRVPDYRTYEQLKDGFVDDDRIAAYAGSIGQVGFVNPKQSFDYLDHHFSMRSFGVTGGYFEAMGFTIEAGRFLTDREQDRQSAIVVNETFVRLMDWEDPIGQTIPYGGSNRTVVGVVSDFHHSNFFHPIDPVLFYGMVKDEVDYFTLKVKAGSMPQVDERLSQLWKEAHPNDAYHRQFQADAFDNFYDSTVSIITLMIVFSVVAIILACLGLYGLIAFHIQARLKEFSVRKVLGATPKHIASIAGKRYALVVLFAFLFGAPLGAWGILQLIQSMFPDAGPVSGLPFVLAFIMIVGTLAITVASQVIRAIHVNPASILRNE